MIVQNDNVFEINEENVDIAGRLYPRIAVNCK